MTPLSPPAAQGTVAGWKLVPIEPTDEMWKAADKQSEFCAIHNYGASPSAEDYWHAMLDAAPLPSPEALPASGVNVEAIARAICKGKGLNPECQNQGAARDGTVDGHWDINSPFGRPYDNRWHYGWRNQVAAAEAVRALYAHPAPATVEMREVAEALIADWDERAVGEKERFVEATDEHPGYWSPNARMVSSKCIAALRAALAPATEGRKG